MNSKKSVLLGIMFSTINSIVLGYYISYVSDFLRGVLIAFSLLIGATAFYIGFFCSGLKFVPNDMQKPVFKVSICGIIGLNSFILIMSRFAFKINIFFPIRIALYILCFTSFVGMFYFSAKIISD